MAINCRSKRVKRAGHEIKSDGSTAAARARRAAVSALRENRAAIIVSYDDHASVYLFVVAPVIYDENASADTLQPRAGRCILRVSMTRRYFIEKSQNAASATSHKSTPFKCVTKKIRTDVPWLSRTLDFVSIRREYFDIVIVTIIARFTTHTVRMIKIYVVYVLV